MNIAKKPPGRKKGIPNKTTAGVKSNLIKVFEEIGGVDNFAEWARENQKDFYSHYVKMLPIEANINANVDSTLNIIINKPKAD